LLYLNNKIKKGAAEAAKEMTLTEEEREKAEKKK
jgi:hypothetical protein